MDDGFILAFAGALIILAGGIAVDLAIRVLAWAWPGIAVAVLAWLAWPTVKHWAFLQAHRLLVWLALGLVELEHRGALIRMRQLAAKEHRGEEWEDSAMS